jgi:1-acyl-sn-glycerol-3-phosphate acyltransferase
MFLRAATQHLLGWSFTAVMAALMITTTLLSFGALSHPVGRPLLRLWGHGMLRILGVRLVVRGRQHVSGRASRIVPFNHASTLDMFIVQAMLPDHGVPVAKREFIFVPIIGWAVYLLDFVLLDRKDRRRAAASLSRAAARITRERLSVVIAPEGTRSRTGELGPFKLGPMHLAVASHAPLVPMVIHGSARAMPHAQLWSRGGTVIVEFLPPIATDDFTLENLHERSEALRATFLAALSRPPAA